MPIGPVTPGNRVAITPDTISALPGTMSITPGPTMPVVSADMQTLALAMMSADALMDAKKVNRSGDTITGSLVVEGNVSAPEIRLTGSSIVGVQRHGKSMPALDPTSNWRVGTYGELTDSGTAGELRIPLDVPMGCTLTGVDVYVRGFGHSAVPDVSIAVVRIVRTTGVPSTIGAVADTSADAAAFDAYHVISLTVGAPPLLPVNTVVDTRDRWQLLVVGESGANAKTGFEVWAWVWTFNKTPDVGLD